MVGSRTTDQNTVRTAQRLALAAADAGVSVVSGLAAGVDAAAHRGALEGGGHTVAAFGTGIRRVFPVENTDLAQRIARTGALVS